MSLDNVLYSCMETINCKINKASAWFTKTIEDIRPENNRKNDSYFTSTVSSLSKSQLTIPDIQGGSCFNYVRDVCRKSLNSDTLQQMFSYVNMKDETGRITPSKRLSASTEHIEKCVMEFKQQQLNCSNVLKQNVAKAHIPQVSEIAMQRHKSASCIFAIKGGESILEWTEGTNINYCHQESSKLNTEYLTIRQNTMHFLKETTNDSLSDSRICVKLSLQYFHKSSQLRVILLNAKMSGFHKKIKVITICTLFRQKTKKGRKQIKSVCESENSNINRNMVFDNIHIDDEAVWALRIKMYSKTHCLSQRKCIGQTLLRLDRLDMFMNTTLSCLLKQIPQNKEVMYCSDEDLEVHTIDESINAHARASVAGLQRSTLLSKCIETTSYR